MSSGSRLGKDPLSRTSPAGEPGVSSSPGSQALRHILDLGQTVQEPESAPDPEVVYKEVAGKFSEAMELLSGLAASAGVWAWGAQSGEGESFLFMRLMAAYAVTPQGEGVNVEGFLNDVHDQWDRYNLNLSLDVNGVLLPLERAFAMTRGLQAALDGFCKPGKHGPALLNLDATLTPRGTLKIRLYGYRDYFLSREPAFESKGAEALVDLVRSGAASILFSCSEKTAELTLLV